MSEDKIIAKLMEHDERFDGVKEEFKALREEMLSGHDAEMAILKRLDEERIFTHKWVKDIEDKVEENTVEIKNIKLRLNVA